ncbi:ABC transporter substrate-binding protein [Microlunatus soli]|uniref:Peptide/nickel transport system substrate-binding protein n=1 Tax=Microlunatus soli TaxID=630515 RepID=A0A1H1VQ03_9ACTN|nr:ABC transporter substrate-binding protein [Microlunatus soli]SDS86967.1 peptide/nickel transport system substrate-binding protein [Microlunatus soli]
MGFSRRTLLYSSAVIASTAALAACSGGQSSSEGSGTSSSGASGAKGSATKPLPKPKKFQQAPGLSGDLPPVAERLPDNPYVIPHKWVKPGKYGGKLNMNVFNSSGATTAESDREFFYGHSVLRWLNDGLDVGPGLAESWETNDDASEWTFHFRKGLKWSDGEPWSTEDILWWWKEFVLKQKMAQTPPDETRSGKGTLAKFEAVDDLTLKLTFDTPAPLTADRMAAYANGNIGKNGATWMMPSHYLKKFHPATGKNVPKDWDTVGGLMESKADWHRNPDCPTMIGYVCKSFDTNKGVVLERNPYYWAVMPNGDQLPYIDEIQFTVVTDPEAGKLQLQQGSVDYCQGSFNQISLGDVQGLRDASEKADLDIILWDTGSGTGSIFFFNYDYIDDDIRKLIREPKFRQAISYAFNRPAIQKSVYFNTGEQTTGTHGAKAAEFLVNETGKQLYKQWRDKYVKHDPAKAKQLLDELGLKEGSDGMRTLPNGKKLELRIDYSADQSAEHTAKDNQLVSDLKAVGLKMTRNPVPPQSFDDEWKTGKLMAHSNWEVANVGISLIQPMWLVPIEPSRWAPLEGQWFTQLGTGANEKESDVNPWKRHPPRMEPEEGGPVAKLWDLYSKARVEADKTKQYELVWEIEKLHMEEGPFYMGCVANYPSVMVVKKGLRNVPRKENLATGGLVNPWGHPTPAVYDPECYYWDKPQN